MFGHIRSAAVALAHALARLSERTEQEREGALTPNARARAAGEHFLCGMSPPNDPPAADDFAVEYRLFDELLWPAMAHRVPDFAALTLVSARGAGAVQGGAKVCLCVHAISCGMKRSVRDVSYRSGERMGRPLRV